MRVVFNSPQSVQGVTEIPRSHSKLINQTDQFSPFILYSHSSSCHFNYALMPIKVYITQRCHWDTLTVNVPGSYLHV